MTRILMVLYTAAIVIGLPFVMAWDLLDGLTRGPRRWLRGEQ
jgi:hypothetical protein